MKYYVLGGLVLAACLSSFPASAKPAKCLVVAEGKKVLDGPCEFTTDDADGSFSISAGKVKANVLADPGSATGRAFYEDPTGAWVIGDVDRKGPCWSNKHGKICAWAVAAKDAKAPAKQAAKPAEPAPAEDVVADIASDEATENLYGSARDWQVGVGTVKGRFAYCYAETLADDMPFRIGTDGGQWQLGLLVRSKSPYEGSIEVDGRSFPASGTANKDWTFVWLDLQMLDAIRNGKEVVVELNRQSIDRPLKGIAAAIDKVEECMQRKGASPSGASAAKATTTPMPEDEPQPASAPVGQPEKLETGFYAAAQPSAGEWTLTRFSSDAKGKKDMYCRALWTKESDLFLRLAYDGVNKEFTYGFAASPPPEGPGQAGMMVWFDQDKEPTYISDESYFLTDPDGGEFISTTDRDDPKKAAAAFASHKTVTILYRLDPHERKETFELKGVKPALDALMRCAAGR